MKTFSASDYLSTIPLAHKLRADGMIEVTGTIHISNQNLTELPDLSNVILTGSFFCDSNQLTSLKGIPCQISGHIDCKNNRISDMSHMPRRAESVTLDRMSYDLLKKDVQKHGLELENISIIGNAIQVDGSVLRKLHDAKIKEQEMRREQAELERVRNIHDTCHNGTREKIHLMQKIILKPRR